MTYNGLQLNADFVLHKICDLGAVMYQFNFLLFCVGFQLVTQFNKNNLEIVCRFKI